MRRANLKLTIDVAIKQDDFDGDLTKRVEVAKRLLMDFADVIESLILTYNRLIGA